MTSLEIAANAITAASILLAARNSVHTWWTGLIGCALFGLLFMRSQLYADATLQVFFIATSLWGWWHWQRGAAAIQRTRPAHLLALALIAITTALAYGSLLHHWTDAYLPFVDSAVMAFSVAAQLLLMQRRVETWPTWLLVNTLSVPLFASRGLHLTAVLYAAFWLNACYGWWHWRRQLVVA